ncbi:MAG: OmpA family protein [Mariprofundales bacterium]
MLVLFFSTAQAEDLTALEQQINRFAASDGAYFSPQATEHARAYLGAALLARDNQQVAQLQQAIDTAQQALREAQAHAADFHQRFIDLLAQRQEAQQSRHYPAIRDQIGAVSPTAMLNKAEEALSSAIHADERGNLNSVAQSVKEAGKWYQQSIAAALPTIDHLAAAVLHSARAANGKYYTPTLYKAAQQQQAAIRAFLNGSRHQLPAHPYQLLRLADDALQLTRKVKAWRKDRGSHESLVLATRSNRRMLADHLGVKVDTQDVTSDVSAKVLMQAIDALQHQLQQERAQHVESLVALRAESEATLNHQLQKQRQQLAGNKQKQLTDLKAAFAAKLERETFDSRRQAALRQLFKKGEAQIMVNLDGSILLRLLGLRFASGRSAIGSDQLPLLGQVAQALALYKERNVHIEGHTDNRGEVKANRTLSLKRAESVRDVLISSGVAASRVKALGYGEVRPIASNEFKQGRAMNRRIDVVIQP